jgi:hypothetical protein
MKTPDTLIVAADPVISEVRRAKTAIGQKYGFDVLAMVQALRAIDDQEDAEKAVASSTPKSGITPAVSSPHKGQE